MYRSEFLAELKRKVPELRDDLNEEKGQLHFEVDVMRKRAQLARKSGEADILSALFDIALRGYENGTSALKNAIDVSFVEPLNFENTKNHSYEWAWKAMPERLRNHILHFIVRFNVTRSWWFSPSGAWTLSAPHNKSVKRNEY